MNKRLWLLLALVVVGGCECQYVRAGNVGVLVQTMGSSKGDIEKVGVGRYLLTPGEDIFVFPTFKQQAIWTKSPHEGSTLDESISIQTKENMAINVDVGLTYHIQEDHVVELFKNYRRGAEEITHIFLRNHVRDAMTRAAASMTIEEISAGRAAFMDGVQKTVSAQVAPLGLMVESIYLVNDMRFPEQVRKAIDDKIAAIQRAQQRENELRETEAESKKVQAKAEGEAKSIIVTAEAQAKANELLSKSLTPQLVEMKRIEKWNGVLPQVSGANTPMLGISLDKKP
jgi:regulator of protease activity HflC (stomatin/prohibitin superfamily)